MAVAETERHAVIGDSGAESTEITASPRVNLMAPQEPRSCQITDLSQIAAKWYATGFSLLYVHAGLHYCFASALGNPERFHANGLDRERANHQGSTPGRNTERMKQRSGCSIRHSSGNREATIIRRNCAVTSGYEIVVTEGDVPNSGKSINRGDVSMDRSLAMAVKIMAQRRSDQERSQGITRWRLREKHCQKNHKGLIL